MRNLNPYPHNSFDILNDAVGRKTDVAARNAIIAFLPGLQSKFLDFDRLFLFNQLESLIDDNQFNEITEHLLKLYGYQNVALRSIRTVLENLQPKSIRYTCQYCSLETIEQMDHVVSQSEFPEFAIHPKNLVPSCSKCNEKKGDQWRINGVKNVLNPYLDILPTQRYLFVNVFLDNYNDVDFEYFLDYPDDIFPEISELIQRHFFKLNLLDRMRRSAIIHLSEFQIRMIQEVSNGRSREELVETTFENSNSLREVFGANHWKPVMEEAIANSEVFWNSIL